LIGPSVECLLVQAADHVQWKVLDTADMLTEKRAAAR
jgi:hypothetical protein